MNRLRSLRLAAACAAVALVPTTSLAQPAAATIRIAVLSNADATSLPVYAQASGIYKKYGLDAKITSFGGGAAVIAAIAGGSLDVGFSNLISAVAALERGIPIIILAPAALHDERERPDNLLVKARGSKLRTGADLDGKTIAVTSLNGALQLGAAAWIDKTGGDSKSVHFIELPTSAMAPALKGGRIDAATLSEPALSQAKDDVEELAVAFNAIGPRWTEGTFVASKAWVEANPDAAHRFVQAMVEAARWANKHHAETAKILAPLLGVDLSIFATMVRPTFGDQLSAALLQPPLDAAVKYGQIKTPYDARQIVTDAQPYWQGVR
jgi:NitT/TauT family transport system substrate-binding protein